METSNLIPLDLPVPPMLEAALGYDGPARWVAFFWSPFGDEARCADGRVETDAKWFAYHVFTESPAVMVALAPHDLGSSETAATHWLLLDRGDRRLYVAPAASAAVFLSRQWMPRGELPVAELPLSDELGDLVSEAAAFQPVPVPPGLIEQAMTQMQRSYANDQALQEWLAAYMPPPNPAAQRAMMEQALAELLRRPNVRRRDREPD